MTTGAKISASIIIATIVILVLYDIFAAAYWGTSAGATLSWVTFTASREYPIIPFGAGLLCGHLFASMPGVASEIKKACGFRQED